MKLILLSRNKIHRSEINFLTHMFENGLEIFHLRKPNASKAQIEKYLREIPEKYLNRVVLHSKHDLAPKYGLKGIHLTRKHRARKLRTWLSIQYLKTKHPAITVSTSFHSLETLVENGNKYDYAFLSPIFNSISKEKHQGKFKDNNLSVIFEKLDQKIIALGGVAEDKIEKVREMGFDGAAVLGAIWTSDDPVEAFIKIKEQCDKQPTVSA